MQDLLIVGSAPTGIKDLETTLHIAADLLIVGRVPTGIKDLEQRLTWMQDLLVVGSAPTGIKDLEITLDIDARSAHRWQYPNWNQGP